MENEQNHMIQAWAKFICQLPFSAQNFEQNAATLIESIFLAQQQGDSCIVTDVSSAEHLKDLVMSTADTTALKPFVYDAPYLYLYRYWQLEKNIAQQIFRLKKQKTQPVVLQPQHANLLTDPHQKAALTMVAKEAFSMITGGPGTGKTYTLARIIAMLKDTLPNVRIAMAASTGKAAQRMKEALMASVEDPALAAYNLKDQALNPVTIHRLLGLGTQQVPRFHAKQPLPYDVIVVDEASMLDLSLTSMLLSAVPSGARLILLGDAQQLTSVDVGAVLADLQSFSELQNNHVHLETSRRFTADAMIGKMAQFIQQNTTEKEVLQRFEHTVVPATPLEKIALSTLAVDHVQLEYLPDLGAVRISEKQYQHYYDQLMEGFSDFTQCLISDSADFDDWVSQVLKQFDHYRILAAVRHGALGLDQINAQIELRVLQQTQQIKKGEWYVGRPVMMTYNDYQLGLANGDIGVCFRKRQNGQSQFEVYFPSLDKWVPAMRLPKNIQTAYALTIHKSQGSEFTHTAVVLDESAEKLLAKELIYTAITRAKRAVSVLAHPQALIRALTVTSSRTSGLGKQLQKAFS